MTAEVSKKSPYRPILWRSRSPYFHSQGVIPDDCSRRLKLLRQMLRSEEISQLPVENAISDEEMFSRRGELCSSFEIAIDPHGTNKSDWKHAALRLRNSG